MPRGRPTIIDEVLHRLLRGLASGMWPPGRSMPPSRRLASAFGVSPGTLRKALGEASRLGLVDVRQRRPVTVREGAAQRAERLLAQKSVRRSARQVAILMPAQLLPLVRDAFYALLIDALQREASRRGFDTSLVPWPAAEQMAVARSLPHKGFDAALFIGCLPAFTGSLFLMYEQGFPFVAFNRRIRGLPLPTVLIDNDEVVRRIAERLVKLGHRNLCLAASMTDLAAGQDRPGGVAHAWLDFLHERGLIEECVLPTYFPWDRHQDLYVPAFADLMHSPQRPTAVVFEHHQWAGAFLGDRRFADLRVPDEVSLATVGPTRRLPSVPWCPPMSTAQVDYERVAECLIETFQKVLAGETGVPTIRLPLQLKLTESIGPAPAG